jgi:hypothetical protein
MKSEKTETDFIPFSLRTRPLKKRVRLSEKPETDFIYYFLWAHGTKLRLKAVKIALLLTWQEKFPAIVTSDEFLLKKGEIWDKASIWFLGAMEREFTTKKKQDDHLSFLISTESEKDKWLAWLKSLVCSDKKDRKTLVERCFILGYWLEKLSHNWELRTDFLCKIAKNTEALSNSLLDKIQHVAMSVEQACLRTAYAKGIASHKTVKANIKQAQIVSLYRELGCKGMGSDEFYNKARKKTGLKWDTINRKVKKMINTTRKTDGIP